MDSDFFEEMGVNQALKPSNACRDADDQLKILDGGVESAKTAQNDIYSYLATIDDGITKYEK